MLANPPVILASDFGPRFWLPIGTPVIVSLLAVMALVTAIALTVPACRMMARHFGVFIAIVYVIVGLLWWGFRGELLSELDHSLGYFIGSFMPLLLALWCIAASVLISRWPDHSSSRAARLLRHLLPWSGLMLAFLLIGYLVYGQT